MFKDFLRFGVPMQLVQLVVSVAVIALGASLWWVSWGATAIAFGATWAGMIWEKSPAELARDCVRRVAARARTAAGGSRWALETHEMEDGRRV